MRVLPSFAVTLVVTLALALPVRLSGQQCVTGTGSDAYKATREQMAGHVNGHLLSNADSAVAMYSKDLRAMVPDGSERVGRDAQRDAYARSYKDGTYKSMTYHVDEFIACGDLAYEWGWNDSVKQTPKGEVAGGNRFIGIWRKLPEGWRMTRFSAALGPHALPAK